MFCASPVLLNLTVIKCRLGLIKWLLWPSFTRPVLFVFSFVDWNVFYCCVLTAQTWLESTWLKPARWISLHCSCNNVIPYAHLMEELDSKSRKSVEEFGRFFRVADFIFILVGCVKFAILCDGWNCAPTDDSGSCSAVHIVCDKT